MAINGPRRRYKRFDVGASHDRRRIGAYLVGCRQQERQRQELLSARVAAEQRLRERLTRRPLAIAEYRFSYTNPIAARLRAEIQRRRVGGGQRPSRSAPEENWWSSPTAFLRRWGGALTTMLAAVGIGFLLVFGFYQVAMIIAKLTW